MNLYKYQQRYSITGKPTRKQPILVCRICDFCGNKFHIDHIDQPTVLYSVQNIGGSDPWFYGKRLFVTPPNEDEVEIDTFAMYNDHSDFVYCQEWAGDKDCAIDMIMEWVGQRNSLVGSLCDCMTAARHAILKKLIEDGKFSLEELCLEAR